MWQADTGLLHMDFTLKSFLDVLLQCDTYKDQYNAAASTAKELQKQLDEVAGLQRAITEAHEVQVFLTCSVVLHHVSNV